MAVFLTASAEFGHSPFFWMIRLGAFCLLEEEVSLCENNSRFLSVPHFFSMPFLQSQCGCVLSITCPRNGRMSDRNSLFKIVKIIPQMLQERYMVCIVTLWYIYLK